jgi:hypothetical protein
MLKLLAFVLPLGIDSVAVAVAAAMLFAGDEGDENKAAASPPAAAWPSSGSGSASALTSWPSGSASACPACR